MPLYEYACDSCGRQFELIRKFSDPPLDVCPHCQSGSLRRLQSAPAIQFKGSGFYITDYARQGGEAGKSDKDKAKNSKSDAAAPQTGNTSETTSSDTSTKSDAPAKPAASTPASASGTKD